MRISVRPENLEVHVLDRIDAPLFSFTIDGVHPHDIAQVAGEAGVSRDGQTSIQRRKENRAEVQVRLTEDVFVIGEGGLLNALDEQEIAFDEVHREVIARLELRKES